jgi:hypothetical protein
VVATMEQCLDGPVIEKMIQDFDEQEVQVKKQVEVARAKLEVFKVAFPRPE